MNKGYRFGSKQSSGMRHVGTSGGKVAPSGVGIGSDKGSTSSTTTAGISAIAGNKEARTGDNETGSGQIFDKEQVRQEVAALLLFILGNADTESAYLAEHRETARELQAQRALAERAVGTAPRYGDSRSVAPR
jgi:hypothetical protein